MLETAKPGLADAEEDHQDLLVGKWKEKKKTDVPSEEQQPK